MDINSIGNNLKQINSPRVNGHRYIYSSEETSSGRVSEGERSPLEPRKQVVEPTPRLERKIVGLKRMNHSMSVEEIERYLRYNEDIEVPESVIRFILKRNNLPENSVNYGMLMLEASCIQGTVFDRIV